MIQGHPLGALVIILLAMVAAYYVNDVVAPIGRQC